LWTFATGWHEPEQEAGTGLDWRWMERTGTIRVVGPARDLTLTITGDKMAVKDSRRTETAVIKLDTKVTPHTITMSPADADAKKEPPAEGIFAVEGDTLRVCWAKKGKERPTEFLTRTASDTVYLLLEREKK